MKANELRIGNWVKEAIEAGGKPVQISMNHFGCDDDLYSHFIDHANPIPLTEEWLVKFGILDLNANEVDGHGDWHTDLKNKEVGICGVDSCTSGMIFYAKCEYVHQLQNLYFCLTGEELTIK